MAKEEKKEINIYIFGAPEVGKTTLIKTFLREEMSEEYTKTENIETIKEVIQVGKKNCTLYITEVPGAKVSFNKEELQKIKKADAVIMIYDAFNLNTFDFFLNVMDFVRQTTELDCKKIIIENKKTRVIIPDRISDYIKEKKEEFTYDIYYIKNDNKKLENANDIMSYVIKKILKLGNHFEENINVRENDINVRNQRIEYDCEASCKDCLSEFDSGCGRLCNILCCCCSI